MKHSQRGFIALPLVLIGLAALGAGTVATASNSLPGQSLYKIKTATEKVRAALALEKDKPAVYMNIAEEKVGEIERLQERAASERAITRAVEELEKNQERALEITTYGKNTKAGVKKLETSFADQQATIEKILERAPETAKPGIERALKNSKRHIERVREIEKGSEKK